VAKFRTQKNYQKETETVGDRANCPRRHSAEGAVKGGVKGGGVVKKKPVEGPSPGKTSYSLPPDKKNRCCGGKFQFAKGDEKFKNWESNPGFELGPKDHTRD